MRHSTTLLLALLVVTSSAQSSMHVYPTTPTRLDPDAYFSEPVPSGLKLEQVHVFVRHGERTPVGVRMQNPPASIPQFWDLCGRARQFHAAVLGDHSVSATQIIKRVAERRDGTSHDNECLLGELTDIGRKSTLEYGKALNTIYVQKLGFLPEAVESNEIVYFRSTNMPRTIESLQQVIHGLYPTEKFINGTVPRVRIRHPQDENLMGNAGACGRLRELMIRFARAAAKTHNPKLAALDETLSKYIDGHPIRVDGKPRTSGILDTVRAAKAHGFAIPPEFEDPKVVWPIEHAVVSEWFDGYKDEEVRRLAMGPLLSELDARFQSKASKGDADPLKISVNACHDTSLAGMAQTLDVFDGRWPEFTASVTMELYKETPPKPTGLIQKFFGTQKPEHYIRMRYQNRSLRLPACAEAGDHLPDRPEFCKLSAFSRRVKELTPENWDKECSAISSSAGIAPEGKKVEGSSNPLAVA